MTIINVNGMDEDASVTAQSRARKDQLKEQLYSNQKEFSPYLSATERRAFMALFCLQYTFQDVDPLH